MKKAGIVLASLFIFNISSVSGQGEFYNWHFGYNAGLNFPNGGNPVPFTNSQLSTAEGSATISDKNGNLLFYTDGMKVWNKNNVQMPQGFGLLGNNSSAQSAIIVPKPGSPNLYYVFTVDYQGNANGLRYSTVDMNQNGNLGDVLVAGKNTLLYTPTCEKITAVKHKNGCDIWVLSHHWGSANLYAYLVTMGGVNPVPVISTPGGQVHFNGGGGGSMAIGYMKANPQGTKVAAALATQGSTLTSSLELYDFNNATGVFSNARMLTTGMAQTYGCEFSPNGQLLYAACGPIKQFDITLATLPLINASMFQVTAAGGNCAMQVAPNGKMYCANATANLNVINNPNVAGVGCGYTANAQSLAGKSSFLGLPSFITSWVVPPATFSFTPNCITTFTISDTSGVQNVSWNFGDPSSGGANVSTNYFPSHLFSGPGTYTVQLILNYACKSDTLKKAVTVFTPSLSVNTVSATCTTPGAATVTISGGTAPFTYSWIPSSQTTSAIANLGPGIYSVIVTDNAGCIKTATANIGSQNPMSGVFSPTAVLCFGGNTGAAGFTVTGGSGNYSYTWSNGQVAQIVNGLTAGIYTVTAQDLNNPCYITKTVQITQPPVLSLSINSSTSNICAGGIINVSSFAGGGTSPYTYTWTPGPTTANALFTQTLAGTYNYSLLCTDKNGCTINKNISLVFDAIPVISVSSQSICIGDKGVLTANGTDNFYWSPVNFSGNTFTVNGVSTMFLSVVGTDASTGCKSLPVTATLVVNPLPVPQILSSKNTGCVPLCMTFTCTNSTAISICNWEFGDGAFASNVTNTDRCFTTAGSYTPIATVTDMNGCKNTVAYNLEAYPIPVADFIHAPLKPLVDEQVSFTDASHHANIKEWDWYFTNTAKPHSIEQNPSYVYNEAGTYAVALVVKSDHGCMDSIVRVLVVGEDYGIYVPNTFTPNGDGLNDIFQPKGYGIVKYELRLFDRWGEELLFTNEFSQGWDGVHKGKLCEEGEYTWQINLVNVFGKSHELSGNVALMK